MRLWHIRHSKHLQNMLSGLPVESATQHSQIGFITREISIHFRILLGIVNCLMLVLLRELTVNQSLPIHLFLIKMTELCLTGEICPSILTKVISPHLMIMIPWISEKCETTHSFGSMKSTAFLFLCRFSFIENNMHQVICCKSVWGQERMDKFGDRILNIVTGED